MKVKINIPSTLREINLNQYKAYIEATERIDSDIDLRIAMLDVFCNIPLEKAKKIAVKDVMRITNGLTKLLNEKPELVMDFEIGDTTFGFIPKLNDMSFGEYIDLDSSISEWDRMHIAMAVLYRPIKDRKGKFYTIQEYTGDNYHEAMGYMPLDAVMSSLVFFYRLGRDLSKSMLRYLETEEVQTNSALQHSLDRNGDGISRFTHSLRGTLGGSKI